MAVECINLPTLSCLLGLVAVLAAWPGSGSCSSLGTYIVDQSIDKCVAVFPDGSLGTHLLNEISSVLSESSDEVYFAIGSSSVLPILESKWKKRQHPMPGSGKVASSGSANATDTVQTAWLVVIPRQPRARECLLEPPVKHIPFFKLDLTEPTGCMECDPGIDSEDGHTDASATTTQTSATEFISRHCQLHRRADGALTALGLLRRHVLHQLPKVAHRPPAQKQSSDEDHENIPTSTTSLTAMFSQATSHSGGGAVPFSGQSHFMHKPFTTATSPSSSDTASHATLDRTASLPDSTARRTSTCARVHATELTKERFLREFVLKSTPVVITGLPSPRGSPSWTNEALRRQYGNLRVGVKVAPHGEFEGVEPRNLWTNNNVKAAELPKAVAKQLVDPNLVVVRPHHLEMTVRELLDHVENPGRNGSASFYLEYTELHSAFPDLKKDVQVPGFAEDLRLEHLNVWLSDGNTVGKLHFDPFENLLHMVGANLSLLLRCISFFPTSLSQHTRCVVSVRSQNTCCQVLLQLMSSLSTLLSWRTDGPEQVSGSKLVTMFGPWEGRRLHEGHLAEAVLYWSREEQKFLRTPEGLSESTSMVMSPVNIEEPSSISKYPGAAHAQALFCRIDEGDTLFMPSFWWHEVKSTRSTTDVRNMAINMWFDPLLKKEFPCASCELDINIETYHELLQRLA